MIDLFRLCKEYPTCSFMFMRLGMKDGCQVKVLRITPQFKIRQQFVHFPDEEVDSYKTDQLADNLIFSKLGKVAELIASDQEMPEPPVVSG